MNSIHILYTELVIVPDVSGTSSTDTINTMTTLSSMYEGRSINKLQNGIILLIFKI